MGHAHPPERTPALPWAAVAAVAQRLQERAAAVIDSLDAAQRRELLQPFVPAARHDWHYVPRTRAGLPLRDMREPQRQAVWSLLEAALSEEGIAKARGVLALEAILQERTANKAYRDPENYALAIFGVPGGSPWAWRMEGHHLSLTFTIVPAVGIAATPYFLGANPFSGAVVAEPAAGRLGGVLERESALAFDLAGSLDEGQWRQALIAPTAPQDLLTGPGRELILGQPTGLALGVMRDDQRRRVLALVETFAHRLDPGLTGPLLADLRNAGIERLHLAWAGAREPGELHYWRLHGPALLIEYDKTDQDHAHSVWHDPSDLFGEDLLRRHHETAHRD